ncbi:hypothetical protein D3C81_1547570 [compost metagenome]
MGQPLFVTVLSDHDQRIDGLTRQLRVSGKQRIGCLYAQIGCLLVIGFTRQECRTDLTQNERFVLAETCTLFVIIRALCRHVARNALDANHHGFPIILAALYHRSAQGNPTSWAASECRRTAGSIDRPEATVMI